MIAAAVKVFVIEPTRYCVPGVASTAASRSASPTAPDQIASPSRTTAAATDGRRASAWCFWSTRSSRGSSSLRAGKELQCLRHQLDRLVDPGVVDVEMRDRAQDSRADRAA